MSKNYKEIENFYRQKMNELKEEYKEALREFLVQAGLDGDVIRIKDGKRGKLFVETRNIYALGSKVVFYPYTKKGTLGAKSDGWSIDVSRDFRKADEENGR